VVDAFPEANRNDEDASPISSNFCPFLVEYRTYVGRFVCLGTGTLTKAPQLAARLVELDSAIAYLQVERFAVLAEIRAIDEAAGKSERQTTVTVAQLSRSSARHAAAQIGIGNEVINAARDR
jgi:hypothetical protein